MYILVSYDVVDGRTETFRKILSRYLVHEQKSVFAGQIEESSLIRLRKELSKAMVAADSILEVSAENRHNVRVHFLKKAEGNSALVREEHAHHRRSDEVI